MNYEFVAMFFGIIGAFAISRAAIEDAVRARNLWTIGGGSFAASNILLFVVAADLGLSAMAIQMILFGVTSALMLRTHSSLVLATLSALATIVTLTLFFSVFSEAFKIGFDIVPSSLALIGSFLISFKNDRLVVAGFVLFIAADLLYLGVATMNNLPWFFLQTVAYLVFSSIALKHMNASSRQVQEQQ
ncbi:MAG: hypothetical protein ACXW33_09925 [Sulfuricurvum sp.]